MDPIDFLEERKLKRFFRSRRKLNVPGFIYHITQRAAGKEPLFVEDDDYMTMLALMKYIFVSHNTQVYAFCLMPNHVHLLISPTEKNLPEVMRKLFSTFASRFNRKYERKGHLFGGPYRQAVCLDDSYIVAASLYIHLNPVRAKLVDNPLNYRWASTGLYCREPKRESFVDPGFVLSLLSNECNPDLTEARKQYLRLLTRGAEINLKEVLEQEEAVEHFLAKLKSVFPTIMRKICKRNNAAKSLGLELLSLHDIEEKIAEIKKNPNTRSPEARRAKKYLVEQLIARGFKKREIAEKLGVSRKTIYNILKAT